MSVFCGFHIFLFEKCSLELEQGDWEAWISRFPYMFKFLPLLKRVVIAGASQSGCGGYDDMIEACLNLPELEYIDCSNNGEDMGQGVALARLIREHPKLKEIRMADNELEEKQEIAVVKAIRDVAIAKKLILEELDGLELNKKKYLSILKLSDKGNEKPFKEMSNKEILAFLKL